MSTNVETTVASPRSQDHERRALFVLRAMMRRQMLDEFGYIQRSGCYDIVCRGIDGDPLPPLSNWEEPITYD